MTTFILNNRIAPVNTGLKVRLVPDLSAAAFKTKTTNQLALWHALRAINFTGSGVVDEEYAYKELFDFNYTRSTVFRILSKGEGQFWSRFQYKGRSRIEIYGLVRVFEGYNTYPFNTIKFYDVPANRFNTTRTRRLALWESIHKSKGVRANPISRHSLEDYTGIQGRQQRRYDNDSQVKTTTAWRPGYHDDTGKPMSRMANIYHTRQLPGPTGQLRKVRRQLKSLITEEALEKKRYFPSNRKMVKSQHKNNPVYILTRPRKRQIYGRIEYQVVLSLC